MGHLLLLRHGETAWTLSRQHTSHTDLPLAAHGEEEAAHVAPLLTAHDIGLVLTSPLRRAVRTAEPAGAAGADVDPDLRGWDYGGYEGITTAEIHRTRPTWNLWTDGVAPGPPATRGRAPGTWAAAPIACSRAASRYCATPPRATCSSWPTATYCGVLTARRLGLPPSAGSLFALDSGTVSRLGVEHGRPVIKAWNMTRTPAAGAGPVGPRAAAA